MWDAKIHLNIGTGKNSNENKQKNPDKKYQHMSIPLQWIAFVFSHHWMLILRLKSLVISL